MKCLAICKLLQNLKIHEEYRCNPRKISFTAVYPLIIMLFFCTLAKIAIPFFRNYVMFHHLWIFSLPLNIGEFLTQMSLPKRF